ncbi:MAG: SDR family oxidoreductase [Alphaproteobacteria bacterium]|nr:SDR family oxidoreductase [Alphaproteobacteria bacterium]
MDYRSVFKPGLFSEQVVIVTGGGSGMGRCMAHELVALGARVALIGRTAAKLEAVRDELGGGPQAAFVHACDLRQEGAVVAAVAAVLGWAGRIDSLVNNAGGQFTQALAELSLNGWNAVVANNLTATFLMSREVYRQWMAAHGGAIVSIGADWDPGMAGMSHASVARAGQQNFTQCASVEWAHAGVRVNQVIPGYIASSGFERYSPAAKRQILAARRQIPAKRFGTEAEVAACVVFLLSEAAAYVSGATLRVDGALHNYSRYTFYEVPEHDRSPVYDGFPLYRPPAFAREG